MRTLPNLKRGHPAVLAVSAIVLGGCGGAGAGSRDEFAIRPIPSFAATNALGLDLFEQQKGLLSTRSARLPTSGTATYEGAVAYVFGSKALVDAGYPKYEEAIINNPDFVSRINLTASFASSSVSGSMNSFRDRFNTPYDIDVEITGTMGSRDTFAVFDGTLTGSNEIRLSATEFETKNFTGIIAGNFLGSDARMVFGTLFVEKGFTGEGSNLFGAFTAEK